MIAVHGDARPRALDLFCGAGGATKGLQMAGFHVTGIDSKPQPRYIGDVFIQADALQPPVRLADFDLVWASPPCQAYSVMRHLPWLKHIEYPKLIPDVRRLLQSSGSLYVIENVEGAPLDGVQLCGQMFGLPTYRHRRFESNFMIFAPAHPRHDEVIQRGSRTFQKRRDNGNAFSRLPKSGDSPLGTKQRRMVALGIDWMSAYDLTQAIPPAYAKHIGEYALMALGVAREE